MIKKTSHICGLIIFASILLANAQTERFNSRAQLLRSVSQQELVETARNHQWALDFTKRGKDTILVIAVRVEFQPDTSTLTTGNGLFGIGTRERTNENDRRELRHYYNGVYRFDNLPHDRQYFASHLTALKDYYHKVSSGNLTLEFAIYPNGEGEIGYRADSMMTQYSPGWKKRTESIDRYWDRKTLGLMAFVRDALRAADGPGESPFRNLYRDDAGILRDATTNRKAAILIFHAGASYLTDGGQSGYPDSPSDMAGAFINRDFFKFSKDSLNLDTEGVPVTGHNGETLIINELMLSPETSNQDSLNWGIQGILVNQMARQLGIPDLYSTWSGVTAIGAFCIMDFAGYSAGQGFIPPYPSAWVRAFMGWDTPVTVGAGDSHGIKALTSVLDRENNAQPFGADTTIILVPLNNNEYYLIENRQRNLSEDYSLFRYDERDDGMINAYPFNVNVEANVKKLSDASNVILETTNNDISLPASGVLVWHIDDGIIRRRLAHNFVNADSSYRGVRLVEADGINDLGVTFYDMFYQAAFDYGGAEDVFPYKTTRSDGKPVNDVKGFGPYSHPSTRANDGGHSYLNIEFNSASASPREEKTRGLQSDNIVTNYSDSVFIVNVKYDHIVQGWPRRAAPDRFYDPLVTNIARSSSNNDNDTVLVLLSEEGKLYLYSVNGDRRESYGDRTTNIDMKDYYGNVVTSSISVTYFDSIPGTFTFPTAIDGRIFIPSTHNGEHRVNIYNSLDVSDKTALTLPAAPSSYVCGLMSYGGGTVANRWAIGLVNGRVVVVTSFPDDNLTSSDTVRLLDTTSQVSAIAKLWINSYYYSSVFAVMQDNGTLSIIDEQSRVIVGSSQIIRDFLPPFKLATGMLDGDTPSIVVTDSRQGVWAFAFPVTSPPRTITGDFGSATTQEVRKLELAQGWSEKPNDWATKTYYIDPENRTGRDRYPSNSSGPALADINRDGSLDIVIGGINGIYAFNRRGALLSKWPAYLDNRYWYLRGSVTTSPIVVSAGNNQPLVMFSSPTGERATFGVTKIESADKGRGVVIFRRDDGTLDSLWDVSAGAIDTMLTLGDSLIYPYILPGGFVDALTAAASRPFETMAGWAVPQSRWPLSAGSPMAASPVAWRSSASSAPDIFAVATNGMIYRWKLNGMISDSLYWPQNGFNAARTFAYGGPAPVANANITANEPPITFWNYPNPTARGDAYTTFKYRFNGPATKIRLDIQSITGRKMDTFRIEDAPDGGFPDWNELKVDLRKYGPGIYRCRMEATIGGKKHVKMWKMAVVK